VIEKVSVPSRAGLQLTSNGLVDADAIALRNVDFRHLID